MIEKYKLYVTEKEKETWQYLRPMRKSLRKHGQYVLLHRIESLVVRCANIDEAKEILNQYFILVEKTKKVL